MILKNRILLSFLLIAGIFVSFIAEANSGTVIASRGEVRAISNDTFRELKQGDHVNVNDEIQTGIRSFVVLQFTDGSKVTIRPESLMIIETYIYTGNDNDKSTFNLVSGGLRVITGAMAKSNPENYKIRTPVALMGVRGTEFSIMLCKEQRCIEDQME